MCVTHRAYEGVEKVVPVVGHGHEEQRHAGLRKGGEGVPSCDHHCCVVSFRGMSVSVDRAGVTKRILQPGRETT